MSERMILTTREAAELLGYDERRMRRLAAAGVVKPFGVPWRFHREDLERYRRERQASRLRDQSADGPGEEL